MRTLNISWKYVVKTVQICFTRICSFRENLVLNPMENQLLADSDWQSKFYLTDYQFTWVPNEKLIISGRDVVG